MTYSDKMMRQKHSERSESASQSGFASARLAYIRTGRAPIGATAATSRSLTYAFSIWASAGPGSHQMEQGWNGWTKQL